MFACSSRREPLGSHRGGEPPTTSAEDFEPTLFQQMRARIAFRLEIMKPPLRFRQDEVRALVRQLRAQKTWSGFFNALKLLSAAFECDRVRLMKQRERLSLRVEQISVRKNANCERAEILFELEERLRVIEERLPPILAWIPKIEQLRQEALKAYERDSSAS